LTSNECFEEFDLLEEKSRKFIFLWSLNLALEWFVTVLIFWCIQGKKKLDWTFSDFERQKQILPFLFFTWNWRELYVWINCKVEADFICKERFLKKKIFKLICKKNSLKYFEFGFFGKRISQAIWSILDQLMKFIQFFLHSGGVEFPKILSLKWIFECLLWSNQISFLKKFEDFVKRFSHHASSREFELLQKSARKAPNLTNFLGDSHFIWILTSQKNFFILFFKFLSEKFFDFFGKRKDLRAKTSWLWFSKDGIFFGVSFDTQKTKRIRPKIPFFGDPHWSKVRISWGTFKNTVFQAEMYVQIFSFK